MKKWLSLLLALVMLFGMIPMDAYATGTDDIYYEDASNVELDMAEITESKNFIHAFIDEDIA